MDYVVQCKTMGISNYEYLYIHSCFDKGCPTKVKKRTRQCRLALWVVRVWLCLMVEVHGDSATRNEKARIRVCAVSFHHAVTPWRSLKAAIKTTITHNEFRHCRVSFSRLQDNLSRNSCISIIMMVLTSVGQTGKTKSANKYYKYNTC